MVEAAGVEPRWPWGQGILREYKKGSESRFFESFLDSSPFQVSESYEEWSTGEGYGHPDGHLSC
jgi:hypothetical protein